MMIGEPIRDSQQNEGVYKPPKQGRNIQQAQELIYEFLLEIVRKWPPEEVLLEFKRLFIYHVDSVSSNAMGAVYEIIFSNNQEEFKNTLKRCCYILVNNWDAARYYKPIRELTTLFQDPTFDRYTASPTLKRLRQWIKDFVNSPDFEELKLFTSRYEDLKHGPWASRYTSYLLVPQYVDLNNPIEQREAARTLSKQLKDRFKFDLAMYVAKSQSSSANSAPPSNPTILGEEALRLIKLIIAKRGRFSYLNLANIFIQQTQALTYQDFKQSLLKYLVFSVENKSISEALRTKIAEKLNELYTNYDNEPVTNALILRTCNRIVDALTIDNKNEPTPLFVQMLGQGNPVTLVVVLLKVILICHHARTHLESRIAELIKHYQQYPEEECVWVINFLEIFNVTFAIYAENVHYNLVKMDTESPIEKNIFDPDTYRIFSQLRYQEKVELFPDFAHSEELIPDSGETL